MTTIVMFICVALVGAAVWLLASGCQAFHRAAVGQFLRIADEVSALRAEVREAALAQRIDDICSASVVVTPWPQPIPPIDFDAWMAARTERAHRQFIERTSQHLPHERTTEQIASYVLGVSLGGID